MFEIKIKNPTEGINPRSSKFSQLEFNKKEAKKLKQKFQCNIGEIGSLNQFLYGIVSGNQELIKKAIKRINKNYEKPKKSLKPFLKNLQVISDNNLTELLSKSNRKKLGKKLIKETEE